MDITGMCRLWLELGRLPNQLKWTAFCPPAWPAKKARPEGSCAVVRSSFAELMLEGGWPSELVGAGDGSGIAVESGGETLYLCEANSVWGDPARQRGSRQWVD